MSMMVSSLLEAKGKTVFTIGPEAQVIDAIKWMAEKSIGSLVVQNKAGKVVGILSERDYARKVVLQGRSSADTPVRDIMTPQVVTTTTGDTSDHCMQVMTDKRIRHLPIVEHKEVVGIVSIGDLVKAVNDDQQVQLQHLQDYIAS